MKTEDVARLFAGTRAGFELIGYQEVGLPHWHLSLSCMVLTRKPIPPLTEFVLRAIGSDLGTVEDASGFLGLDKRIVTACMVPLFQEGFIRASVDKPDYFELTDSGRTLVASCEMVVPEETVFPLDYDGWTRRLVDLGNVVEFAAADLKKLGVFALPAFPTDPPSANEISVAEVRAMVLEKLDKKFKGGVTVRREVLSVEGLAENRKVFYIQAVALLFKSVLTGEAQVGFAIDGRLSPEHEAAFSRAAGLKKLGVMEALKQSSSDVLALELDPETLAAVDDRPEVTELARLAAARKRELLELEAMAKSRNDTDPDASADDLSDARDKLAKAEARLTQYPVRMLEVFEHPDLLEEALSEASERLLIVSPWIRAAVVNDGFLSRLRGALERGVDVTICYGINRRNPGEGSDAFAVRALESLVGEFPNFVLGALGNTHAKVLLLDHRYVVVTSFNWLSFRGDPSKPFRDERGVLVAIPSKIDAEYDKYMARVSETVVFEEDLAQA